MCSVVVVVMVGKACLYALHVGVVLVFSLGRRLDSADINRPWVYSVDKALCVASRWRSRTLSRVGPETPGDRMRGKASQK